MDDRGFLTCRPGVLTQIHGAERIPGTGTVAIDYCTNKQRYQVLGACEQPTDSLRGHASCYRYVRDGPGRRIANARVIFVSVYISLSLALHENPRRLRLFCRRPG